MKMNAAFLDGIDDINVRQTDVPAPKADEALLKVNSCAVCGSDLKIFHYGNQRVKYPTIVGHEVSGEVVEVGTAVEAVGVGDRVAVGADIPGVWNTNVAGKTEFVDYATGHEFAGGFAQYMLLNAEMIKFGPMTRLPDQLSFEAGALAEPLACALHGLELAQFGPGKSIAVIGLGPIGVMILQVAHAYGASGVFGIQRSRTRLEMARRMVDNVRYIAAEEQNVVETVLAETDGLGVDCVITSAGTVQSHVDAIHMVAHRGFVNLFGGLRGQPPLTIDSNIIHYKECFVTGSHGCLPRHHKQAVQLLASGKVSGDRYIHRRFPLDRIRDAYAYHESRAGLKVVIKPNGD
ncbi:MAG: L-threonine 3-dehydrogenase [Spirochaetaceae bacterium]|nr:MAG: L-threonine 3-dehydrogenase [Spirochaetaceae bacterium]